MKILNGPKSGEPSKAAEPADEADSGPLPSKDGKELFAATLKLLVTDEGGRLVGGVLFYFQLRASPPASATDSRFSRMVSVFPFVGHTGIAKYECDQIGEACLGPNIV